MRYLAPALVIALLPLLAHGQIKSSVSAEADSGGNTVGPGGTIETGDERASTYVKNTVQGTSTNSVYIRTETKGEVHEETIEEPGPVQVSVRATPAQTQVEIKKGNPLETVKKVVDTNPVALGATVQAQNSVATTAPEVVEAVQTAIEQRIQNVINNIVAWFRGLFRFS